ncbi:MAG TPA: ATP-binding cassette domain-containing protein [Actinomycetota bacterium]
MSPSGSDTIDDRVGDDAGERVKESLQAVSAARSALPNIQAALAAGRAPAAADLATLAKAASALTGAARGLGLEPGRATVADLEAELAARESSVAQRPVLRRLAHAAAPAAAAPSLATLAGEAAALAGKASWSPADEARALVLARLVELADAAAAEPDDDEHIVSLDAELRRVLGPPAAPVVLAAARGRLVLPPAVSPGRPANVVNLAPRAAPSPQAGTDGGHAPKRPVAVAVPAQRAQVGNAAPRPLARESQSPAAVPDSAEVIRTQNLTKVYPGMDVPAVDRLNLTVHAGEIFGLLGPNGAGKTTTAGMLTTRVMPTSGKAIVGGIDVVAHPALAKQAIGVVTQQNTLDRSLNVWENLYYHGRYFGMSSRASRAAAGNLLAKFHLAKWSKAPVSALSGGMAQRLMVARAILHRPRILFMDEPTAGLDPQSRLALWEILSELHAEGQTILLTTHYMEEADQLCDRVAIMDHGKVLALDTPARLKSSLGAETIVTVSAEGDLDTLAGILRREVEGVTQTQRVDSTVLLHVRGASGVLPQVVTSAERGGFAVSDLSVAEPTLETVFIHLTGKELRD